MGNLPGLSNDKQFQNENEYIILFYKAYRSYYISLFYLINKKYREAVGFCFKVDGYLKQLKEGLDNLTLVSGSKLDNIKLKNELKMLASDLNQAKYKTLLKLASCI